MAWPFFRKKVQQQEQVIGLPGIVSNGYTDLAFSGANQALSNSPFWACVMNLCRTFASLPVHLYERNGESRQVNNTGAMAQLLKNPCPYMTSYQWRFVMGFNYEIHGVAYARLRFSSLGDPIQALPVSPRLLAPVWREGILTYRYMPSGEEIPATEILATYNTPVGFSTVLSPVEYAQKDIDVSTAAKNLQTNYYRRGTTIGSVVTVPRGTPKEVKTQLKAMFSNEFAGAGNAYKNLIVEDGMKYEPIRLEEKDSQKMTEAMEWTLLEVCRRFGVPPFFAGDLSKATYANSEQQGTQLVLYCIMPRTTSWEDSLNALIKRPGQYVKFNLGGLMRGDHAARSQFYRELIQNGVMTINEARALEDLNPVPNGDTVMFPMNFTSLDNIISGRNLQQIQTPRGTDPWEQVDENQSDALVERRSRDLAFIEATAAPAKSSRARIESLIRKQLKAEIAEIQRLIATNQQQGVQTVIDNFREFCDKLAGQMAPEYTAIYQDVLQRMIPVVQTTVNTGDEIDQETADNYAATLASGMAGRHGSSRAGEIQRAFAGQQENELADIADEVVDHWLDVVPASEAKQETNRATNAMNLFIFSGLGVRYMHVVANPDACEFCQKLDGKVAEVNGAVLAKGTGVDDGQGNVRVIKKNYKHPPWHNACECGIAPGR